MGQNSLLAYWKKNCKKMNMAEKIMLDLPLCGHTHHEWTLQQKADLTKKTKTKMYVIKLPSCMQIIR